MFPMIVVIICKETQASTPSFFLFDPTDVEIQEESASKSERGRGSQTRRGTAHLSTSLSLGLLSLRHLSLSINLILQLSLLSHTVEFPLLLLKLLLFLFSHVWQQGFFGLLVEVGVEGTDDGVCVVDCDGADVCEGLDLGGAELDLGVCHCEGELFDAGLDCVPAGQAGGEVDVTLHAKVGRVNNLVGGRVGENGLGVDTSLVGEGGETGNVVVEGNVDLDRVGDQILNRLELVEIVLALE